MANRKTEEERLQEIEKKLKQLQAQKQAIQQREKEKFRKERTRRLIQIGALAEKYLNCENIEPTEFEIFIDKIVSFDVVKSCISERKESNKISDIQDSMAEQ